MILATFLLLTQATAPRPAPTKTVAATVARDRSALVIILDDVAIQDWLSAATPRLDELAAAGSFFTNAHANGVCSPTRRSLMTGTYWSGPASAACDQFDPERDADASVPFIGSLCPGPSMLTGKWHLGGTPSGSAWPHAALERGFASWRAGMGGNVRGCDGTTYFSWRRCDDGIDAGLETSYEATESAAALEDWWEATPGPKLGVWAPQLAHGPFHVPPAPLLPPGYPTPVLQREKYEAMVAAFDTLAGVLLEGVDFETTLVIVVGDNGTPQTVAPLGLSGRVKTTVFDRGTHVPLLMLGAGQTVGSTRTELVHVVDIAATLAEWFGTLPIGEGQSFLRPSEGHPCIVVTGETDRGVRTLTHLLRRTEDGDELYNTVSDPGELVNVADVPAQAETLAELRYVLDEFDAR